ncbi:Peptidyl-prolyl cis-trans isomerase PIN4 [Lachnellula arida]|uniref:Peptidyl-prolyl cis-trans isomerase n=1 Tax=Lachnellula arida TaxID=1316785 RepID=A0A8T9BD96_9HELO|nr:Peptidyl-prolyl cis-trans isomerase PIN4 [Lachnellula arida]
MAPKGKAAAAGKDKGKGKGKGKEDTSTEEKGGKVKGAQQINVRHILCEKHGKKEEALEKLRGGAKFDEVAREFSEDKARVGMLHPFMHLRGLWSCLNADDEYVGGLLGWKTRGDLDPTFEAAAVELEASTTASPKYVEVKTGFGYHIIMVEGRK